jgi:fructose-bisphosphate aldolase class I
VDDLQELAAALVVEPKGILAADESIPTMSTRLEAAGVIPSAVSRRDYRELLLTTPGLARWISGIIWCDETLRQELTDGTPFPQACAERQLYAGIKVDTGVVPLPGANGALVTEGLDGLGLRLVDYRRLGARFAKWRAVFDPSNLPACAVRANAHALARYAAACQEAGLVPIVEPEVLMDADHGIDRCATATTCALTAVFEELDHMGVELAGMVLKPNMVIAGAGHRPEEDAETVAEATVAVLRACVPEAVAGIAFLSGGQSNLRACTNLAAIGRFAARTGTVPWRLTFSFGRALVRNALVAWHGDPAAVDAAQQALADNCARAAAASQAATAWPGPSPQAAVPVDQTAGRPDPKQASERRTIHV